MDKDFKITIEPQYRVVTLPERSFMPSASSPFCCGYIITMTNGTEEKVLKLNLFQFYSFTVSLLSNEDSPTLSSLAMYFKIKKEDLVTVIKPLFSKYHYGQISDYLNELVRS